VQTHLDQSLYAPLHSLYEYSRQFAVVQDEQHYHTTVVM
jgi:hypothetical protein